MKMTVIGAIASVGLAALAAVVSAQNPPEPALKVGDQAPDFALPGSDGKTHRLSDYRGKTVVLAWFPMAFTGGWTAQCQSLRESGTSLKDFDIAYFMASVDPIETNTKFAAENKADYPILSDTDKKVASAYGVIAADAPPERQRARRWTFYIGPDGKILHIDQKVSVKSAGDDTVRKLEELGVPKKK